jgi:hypothetical protein
MRRSTAATSAPILRISIAATIDVVRGASLEIDVRWPQRDRTGNDGIADLDDEFRQRSVRRVKIDIVVKGRVSVWLVRVTGLAAARPAHAGGAV